MKRRKFLTSLAALPCIGLLFKRYRKEQAPDAEIEAKIQELAELICKKQSTMYVFWQNPKGNETFKTYCAGQIYTVKL